MYAPNRYFRDMAAVLAAANDSLVGARVVFTPSSNFDLFFTLSEISEISEISGRELSLSTLKHHRLSGDMIISSSFPWFRVDS